MRLLDPHTQPDAIEQAAQRLADGGLLALPTETVYGLGARADDDAAVARIFAAKGRPAAAPWRQETELQLTWVKKAA